MSPNGCNTPSAPCPCHESVCPNLCSQPAMPPHAAADSVPCSTNLARDRPSNFPPPPPPLPHFPLPYGPQPFEEHAYEFGGCEYKLVVLPAGGAAGAGAAAGAAGGPAGPCPRVRLLVRLAELGGAYRDQVLGREVVAGVAAAFQGVAALMPQEQVGQESGGVAVERPNSRRGETVSVFEYSLATQDIASAVPRLGPSATPVYSPRRPLPRWTPPTLWAWRCTWRCWPACRPRSRSSGAGRWRPRACCWRGTRSGGVGRGGGGGCEER